MLWKRVEKGDKERCERETRGRGREGVCMSSGLHVSWADLNMRSGISGAVLWPTQNSSPLFHHFPEPSGESQPLQLWDLIILPSEVKAKHGNTSGDQDTRANAAW